MKVSAVLFTILLPCALASPTAQCKLQTHYSQPSSLSHTKVIPKISAPKLSQSSPTYAPSREIYVVTPEIVSLTDSTIPAISAPQAGTPTVREVSQVQESVSLCTQYAYHAANGYEILNNLWGKDAATSGSQCTYYDGTSGSGIKWSTQWTWAGAQDNVKSYAYAGKILTKGQIVSKVKSMPTALKWKYDVNNMRCNVAYDVFTAADPDHVNSSGDYELMIW
jgi:hypothetical protein